LSVPGNRVAEQVPDVSGSDIRPHIFFAGTVAASIIIYWNTFSALAFFSLHEESSSHIPLIPAVSIYLLYIERRRIFESVRTNALLGALLILAGMALHWFAAAPHSVVGHLSLLPAETLSVVLLWIGAFGFC
jgi:hypothetical protein